MPPDERKGCAFPAYSLINQEAMPPILLRGTASRTFPNLNGKAEPFRTSGGQAANNDEYEVENQDLGTKTRPKYLAGKALASMLLKFEHDKHEAGVLLLGSTPEACVP